MRMLQINSLSLRGVSDDRVSPKALAVAQAIPFISAPLLYFLQRFQRAMERYPDISPFFLQNAGYFFNG